MRLWILAVLAIGILWSSADAQQQRVRQNHRPRTVGPQPVLINDVDQAAVATHPVTPFLEHSSAILVDIDLSKVNVGQIVKWVFEVVERDAEDATARQAVAMADGFVQSLRAAGVSHLFASAATRSWFDGGPVVIVPCDNTAAVNGLASLVLQGLPKNPPQTTVLKERLLLAGPQAALERLQVADSVSRADLVLPLTAPDRLDHMIVVSLPQEARQELIAVWPDRLPGPLPIKVSPRQLAQDLQRVVIEWRLPPNVEARITLSTPDPDASRRVIVLIDELMELRPKTKELFTVAARDTDVVIELQTDSLLEQLAPFLRLPKEQAAQLQRSNQLKQVGIAIHNYYEQRKHLPPRCFVDPEGKPLLSGLVAILPFLEQQALYDSFRFDRAWDHEANANPSGTAVPAYAGELLGTDRANHTRFRFPVFPGSLWEGEGPPRRFQDVTDGTSNTIAMIEAPPDAAVPWASPEPWVISNEDPISDVFGDRDTVLTWFLDGSVRVLQRGEIDNETLKAMLTIAGGEVVH